MANLTVTASSVLASSAAMRPAPIQGAISAKGTVEITPLLAGVDIAAGQPVYFEAVTKTYKLASATGASDIHRVAGIAENTAAAGQPLSFVLEDTALHYGGTEPAGTILIASATAGRICPAADAATGWYVCVLGVADGAGNLNFKRIQSEVAVP